MGARTAGFLVGSFGSLVTFGGVAWFQLLRHMDMTTALLRRVEADAGKALPPALAEVEQLVKALEARDPAPRLTPRVV
jgi:hypothetical protein